MQRFYLHAIVLSSLFAFCNAIHAEPEQNICPQECQDYEVCYNDLAYQNYPQIQFPLIGTLEWRIGTGRTYTEGYQTAEAFLGIYPEQCTSYSFVDLRAHRVGDLGRLATNTGIGWRTFSSDWEEIFGVNVYYDTRNEPKKILKQIGIGGELLFRCWEIRANGYHPVGKKEALLSKTVFDQGGGLYDERRCSTFPLWGIDVEIGRHLFYKNGFDLFVGAAPFFYGSKGSNAVAGGMGRVYLMYNKWLTIQGYVTQDDLYDTRGQFDIRITLPLCSSRKFWRCFYYPVERNPLITTEKICRWRSNY